MGKRGGDTERGGEARRGSELQSGTGLWECCAAVGVVWSAGGIGGPTFMCGG